MKKPLKSPKQWLLVLAIAVILLIVSLYAFRLSFLVKPEESLIQNSVRFKKFINVNSNDNIFYHSNFITDNFLLINTTQDVNLGKTEDEEGRIAITDRKKLAQLFRWLHRNPDLYNLAVCDLRFINAAETLGADEELRQSIDSLLSFNKDKIIFAGEFDEGNGFNSFFDKINKTPENVGNTQYVTNPEIGFLDYSLITGKYKVKSMPLLMYEKINNFTSEDGRILGLGDEEGAMGLIKIKYKQNTIHRIWNNYVPELAFSNDDIELIHAIESTELPDYKNVKMQLGTAVYADGDFLENFCENWNNTKSQRIILIGAFGNGHSDKHQTMYGPMDGTVILLNVYFGLDQLNDEFTFDFLLVLLLFYILIAADIVFQDSQIHSLFSCIPYYLFGLFIIKILLDAIGSIAPGYKKAAIVFKSWVEDEAHYFLLIGFAFFINMVYGKVMNIALVIMTVFVFYQIFKYLHNKREKRQ